MEKITKENFLRDKENKIKNLVSSGDDFFVKTFNFLYVYYLLKNLFTQSPILSVFIAIYIKKLKFPAWKLANYCNLSRSSLFNYRNEIVRNFESCLNERLIEKESIFTEGLKL